MSEPVRRDREVAVEVAEFTCDVLTSRSLYEAEELAVRDVAGPVIAAYREQCERAERERVLNAVAARLSYVGGPHIFKVDGNEWTAFLANLRQP